MQTQRVIENVPGKELAVIAIVGQKEHVENVKGECRIEDSTYAIRVGTGDHGEINSKVEGKR